ncbi:GEF1 [Candida pseudojiufengensis]|uniref:GEF1 n=1 Tax=Candida pseudojiufengensis TaxID=497109 RepID=UPI002223FE25|nr:GEF1 [Candida pseudojiufengensis]KAI5966902.1 GEF1 [Candida pseudojiufengensis]
MTSTFQQFNESFDDTLVQSTPESTISIRDSKTGSWVNQDSIPEVSRFNDFRTIDWVEDELDEQKQRLLKIKKFHSGSTNLKDKILSQILNWIVLAIMGIVIGLIAGCLNIITSFLASLRVGYCKNVFYLSENFCCWGEEEEKCENWSKWSRFEFLNYIIFVLISISLSYTAAKLVKFYAPFAAGSGISEIKCIVSGFVMDGFLGWWTLLIKSLGLPLAIGSGLSVGKEGPSVHYAVCVGNSIAKLITKYKKSASKGREFLTATAAAGVAVAFGSPMGGVLFSVEEISSIFQLSTLWKSYFCSLIAVTTLAAINPFRTGQLVLFEVTYDTNWHYFEIPVYIILGIFGGVYGIIVSKFNIRVVGFRKKYLASFAVREVVILTLLTASFSYFNQFLRLDMTESIQMLFHECDSTFNLPICDPNKNKTGILVSLIFATFARMCLTIITYGCKVPAGIFVPSMAAGATFGRALGIIIDHIYKSHPNSLIFSACKEGEKCIIPGTYAFLGAGAGLCGITDLTVTVVIIMFELTGAVRYIIPTMIVVAITKSINDKWGKGGIADQMIKFNGLPLIDAKEDYSFGTSVASAMSSAVVCFSSDSNDSLTLEQLKTTLNKTTYRGYPIIQSGNSPKIQGYISRYELEYNLKQKDGIVNDDVVCNFNTENQNSIDSIDFSFFVNKSPLTVNINTALENILDIFLKLGPRYILIEENGLLAGIITRKDILRYEYSHHHQRKDFTLQQIQDASDLKIWEFMKLMNLSVRKNFGKILYNDPNRYVPI